MATPSWYVEIVHVTSLQKQQDVLRLFEDVAGLTAMAVSSGDGHFVVLGTIDTLLKSAAEVLISEVDPAAVLTYNSDARTLSRMIPGYPSGPWAESHN